MRNLANAIKRVGDFKGDLSKSIVCGTAKTTLNQFKRGWATVDASTQALVQFYGVETFLEEPLLNRHLDAELTTQGIEFLKRYLFTSKGARRRTKDLKYTPDAAFDIVKDFSHFTFAGFDDDGYGNFIPIWRVWNSAKQYFDYTYTSGRFGGSGGFNVLKVSHAKV